MSTMAQPPAPRQTNAVWWVLGALGAILLVVVLGGLLSAAYFLRSVRIDENGKKVQIRTPVGQLQVQEASKHISGLPVYPGARPDESGANVQLSSGEDKKLTIAAEKYRTDDGIEKAQVWYRSHLGPEFQLKKPGAEDSVEWHGKRYPLYVGPEDFAFVDNREDSARIVALKKLLGGTEIDLVRIAPQEVQ